MTTEMQGVEVAGADEFDVLLNDVLRTVANPEVPERVRVHVRTRVWVREMSKAGRSAVVYSPEVFLARMQPKRDVRTTAAAVLLHVAAIGLIFWVVSAKMALTPATKTTQLTALTTPPPIDLAKDAMGGGGGQHDVAPVSKGALPKFEKVQITPPKAPPMEQPKIHMPDPSVEVQTNLKMADNHLPNLGMPNSPLMGSSMGNGRGTGVGDGSGDGIGAGSGGNYGGGIERVGGGVSTPVVIFKVEPEFSEEARKAKFMGNVLVSLVVDPQGMPQAVHVTQGAGMGLNEKAVEAVKQYRFKPAMKDGKPVAVYLNVEVNFQIF